MASSPPPAKRRRETKDRDSAYDTSSLDEKLSPVVVFAHGAGAPSSSDWMIRFCGSLFFSLFHFVFVFYYFWSYLINPKMGKKKKQYC